MDYVNTLCKLKDGLMKNSTFRWPVMVLVMLLTVAMIYGLNQWHQQRVVEEPLIEKLEQLDSVQRVEVSTIGDEGKISFIITLSECEKLPETYKKMEELLRSCYKKDEYLLIVADNRNSYLKSIYEKVQFALMEGERTGNYTKMYEEVSGLIEKEESELVHHLWVDQNRIYFVLSSGPYNLYEIIPVRLADNSGQAY